MKKQYGVAKEVIGPNLAYIRALRGFKQQFVADKAGCTRQHLSRIENGKVTPSYDMMDILAEVLQVNVSLFSTKFIELDEWVED